jgi:hypothetical protein
VKGLKIVGNIREEKYKKLKDLIWKNTMAMQWQV